MRPQPRYDCRRTWRFAAVSFPRGKTFRRSGCVGAGPRIPRPLGFAGRFQHFDEGDAIGLRRRIAHACGLPLRALRFRASLYPACL